MAFARHNIEKHRLIEMVRLNPILWDCRLPHYKRSDKKKDIKWCELGRAFNVSGERVQRTFTSLREIFRRELNHEKLLGDRFTSKWEYYGAMSFLKDVIRERKTRERYRKDTMTMFKDIVDEYHYNRNCLPIQPDVIIHDSPLNLDPSSSRSSTPSLSIKEEPTDHDGDDECNDDSLKHQNSRRQKIKTTLNQSNNHNGSPGPTASTSSYKGPSVENNHCNRSPGPTDSTLNYQKQSTKQISSNNCTKTISDPENDDGEEDSTTKAKRQTPREILYTKFGDFLAARLNTLNETVANDLMNRILLLIAENR